MINLSTQSLTQEISDLLHSAVIYPHVPTNIWLKYNIISKSMTRICDTSNKNPLYMDILPMQNKKMFQPVYLSITIFQLYHT